MKLIKKFKIKFKIKKFFILIINKNKKIEYFYSQH